MGILGISTAAFRYFLVVVRKWEIMVRTVIAALLAPALLWTVGCGSQTAQTPAEGQTPSTAQSTPGSEAASPAVPTPSGTASDTAASRDFSAPTTAASSASASTQQQLSPEEYLARGMKFSEQGRRREAMTAYSAALKNDPKNLSALLYRAGESYALQEFDAAERDVTQALTLDPTYAEAYILRAHLWGVKHDYARAVDDFSTSLQHPERDANFAKYFGDKKDVVAHVYLAAAYSECPDLNFRDDEKAYQHALQACQLDEWQNRRYVSLLVNAIAGSETQEDAVRRQSEAVAAAPNETVKEQLQVAVEAFDYRSEFPLR